MDPVLYQSIGNTENLGVLFSQDQIWRVASKVINIIGIKTLSDLGIGVVEYESF